MKDSTDGVALYRASSASNIPILCAVFTEQDNIDRHSTIEDWKTNFVRRVPELADVVFYTVVVDIF